VLADLELKRTRRHGGNVSLLVLDIDFFKKINDEWGHPEGDKVLHAVVQVIRGRLRSTDILARFGGEEFIVLMPHTDLEQAQIVAETLRQCIAEAHTQPGLAQPRPVTASFGVATLRPDETHLSDLIRRADIALYEAKRKGRNRVEVDPA
jgi:diguanylate cyclase (GGDEF)-like protein